MPRTQDPDTALFREALRQWLDWYMTFYGDRPARPSVGADPTDAGTVYDVAMQRLSRPSDAHSDPVLARMLAEERQQWAWPASIHAIVMDMTADWRVCLFGTAMDYSQSYIGEFLKLRQPLVSVMLKNARVTMLIRLKVLAHTHRVAREMGMRLAA